MNDFTKEELKEIKRCIKYMIDGNTTPYSSLTIKLNKNLQLMIDNYCENSCIHSHKENVIILNN